MTVMIFKVPEWTPSADDMRGSSLPSEVAAPGEAAAGPGGDWPTWFARMLTEALAGSRPARQILPWTNRRARSQFDRLLRSFRGGTAGTDGQPRVLRVLTTRPAQDVIEMSVIAGFGPRTRALALRLERATAELPDARHAASGGWVCTDIEAA
ncbi:MAG TPA: Rv3235 family protein [Trebonia sp.]